MRQRRRLPVNEKKMTRRLSYPYIVWMAIFVIVPLIIVCIYGLTDKTGALTLENVKSIASPVHLKALFLSLKLSIISTVLCFVLALPLALVIRGMHLKSSGFIIFVFILPMWMNFLLRTMAWQLILSNNGVLNTLLGFLHLPKVHIIYTFQAVLIGMVYDFLPFMILPIYTTILKLDGSLMEAAVDLGANSFQTFVKVTLPLTVPGIVSGIVMVFLPSMTNYVVLDMLYNSTYIMGSLIGSYFSAYNWNGGSMIALVLLVIILVFTLVTNKYTDDDGGSRGGALL